jgi:predicted amidohydrolase YtcJ
VPVRPSVSVEARAIRRALCALAALATLGCPPVEEPRVCGRMADTVFVGGDVVTANESMPEAEALAVRNGRIVAVGRETEIRGCVGPATTVVDLAGRALLPGLIEAHTHIRDMRVPTRRELDALAPDNPLMILTQMMHVAYANSRAFELAGVTRDTVVGKGGAFGKDRDGELDGTILEVPALARFVGGLPPQPHDFHVDLLRRQYGTYAAAGYTTIVNPGQVALVRDPVRLMQEVADESTSPIRVRSYVSSDTLDGIPFGPGFGNERYRVLGLKLWLDGSPYAGGMATREPYLDTPFTRARMGLEPGHRGNLNYTDEQLTPLVEKHHRAGWQIALHVQGERAIDQALRVYGEVLRRFPRDDHRHRLEHNALITDEQLARAAELGLTVSFFINHVRFYGEGLRDRILGRERAERFMPMQSALRAGHRVSLHTDNPASPVDALGALRAAVTRSMRGSGDVLGPDERISIDDAIAAVTIDAAWQIFEEDRYGSLEVDKVADLTILSANPREVDPERLGDLEVVGTYLAGEPSRGLMAGALAGSPIAP